MLPFPIIEKSSELYTFLVKKLFQLWKVETRKDDTNPNPNPVSFCKENIKDIEKYGYVISEKADGIRYNLLLCLDNDSNPIAIMIDRKLNFYKIPLSIQKNYFTQESLLDGEWIENNNTWFCFDVIIIYGKELYTADYESRMEYGSEFIKSISNSKDLYFKIKPFYSILDLKKVWSNRGKDFPCDGIIFTPTTIPVQTGTHYNLFKWKENHTIDFQWKCKKDKETNEINYGLFYMNADWSQKYASKKRKMDSTIGTVKYYDSCSDGIEFEDKTYFVVIVKNDLFKKLLTIEQEDQENIIIECSLRFHKSEQLLCKLDKIRQDKNSPNNRHVLERTLLNIKENINFNELCNLWLHQE